MLPGGAVLHAADRCGSRSDRRPEGSFQARPPTHTVGQEPTYVLALQCGHPPDRSGRTYGPDVSKVAVLARSSTTAPATVKPPSGRIWMAKWPPTAAMRSRILVRP